MSCHHTASYHRRKGEPKLTFDQDLDATKALPSKLINPYDTKPLIDNPQEEKINKETEKERKTDPEVPKKKKSRKALFGWLILALVLIGGGIAAWMLSQVTCV